MTNKDTKMLIDLCTSFSELDDILNKTWCKTESDKVEYLTQLYNIKIVHRRDGGIHEDYLAIAQAIIEKRHLM